MNRKLLSLVICLAMMFSLTVNVSAASVSDFKDVPSNSWYYNSVKFVADKDYMNGTSATTFSPSDNMTRAMFVTVLSRMAKADVDNNAATSFTDVKAGQWYTGAVAWGNKNGLVTGYSSTKFGTDDPITREDIAVLVDRYVKFMGYNLKTKPQVDSFKDAADISSYAKDAVEACRLAGLYYGYTDGTLKPKENVTRAEVAAIIERMEILIDEATKLTISPNGGTFSGTQTVTLSTDIKGAVIYYTLDGTDPTTSSTLYTGPFTINKTTTVKAIAVVDGKIVATASAVFTKTSSSGGGGGGGTTTTYKVLDYQVTYSLKKDNITPLNGSAANAAKKGEKNQSDGTYHVTLDDSDKYVDSRSDYITLAEVAKDLCNAGDIDLVLRKIGELTVNGQELFYQDDATESYVFQEIVVKKVPVADIVNAYGPEDENPIIQEIANSLSVVGTTVTNDSIMRVIHNLDNGEKITNEIDKEIGNALYQKLSNEINTNENVFVEKVKSKAGTDILKKLGIADKDIITMAKDYLERLDKQVNNKTYSQRAVLANEENTAEENTTASAAGGIEVKLNPAKVVIKQFEEQTWNTVWDKIVEQVDKEFGFTLDENIYKSKAKALYDACDPNNFINTIEKDNDIYALKTAKEYEEAAADIIDAANELRKTYVTDTEITGEKKQYVIDILDKVVDKASGIGLGELLTRDRKAEIARLAVIEEPTLLDVTRTTKSFSSGVITISEGQIEDAVTKLLSRLGIDEGIDQELMDSITGKLAGNYSGTITITVSDACNKTNPHA